MDLALALLISAIERYAMKLRKRNFIYDFFVSVRYPTTNIVNPANIELEVCQASREDVFDPRPRVYLTTLTLIVAVRQLNEIFSVTMKVKDDYFYIVSNCA